MNKTKYQPVIGLEVHVELKTKSKMFCGCSAQYFGKEPNTHVCPVCLGLPGALPVPNNKAMEWCVMIGLALNCKIPLVSKFDRKNYFYPDLPKGYQISQYDEPIARNGSLKLKIKNEKLKNNLEKTIRIRRVHLEEDTAKLIHQFGNQKSKIKNQKYEEFSLIDFNRSGVPLVEIVSEPDFESALEVVEYLKKLQQIVRYLDVSNADMEKGEMRLEPNISLREISNVKFQIINYKVEVKNINSFRFVEKAIDYELKRQEELLKREETPVQETRGWDENKQKTISQRSKEEAHDYRYFPEPDIPPVHWTGNQISNIKNQIEELPSEKLERFKKEYGLNDYDAEILTRDKTTADYFEEAVKIGAGHMIAPKQIANVVINKKIDISSTLPAHLITQIVSSRQTATLSDEALEKIITQIIDENPKPVEDYKKGKSNALMFLVGQVIRKYPKKIDAGGLRERMEKMLQ
ncbi:MAG: Asp-tRNA(Asn)/Glu-tRNA(Gln) amidotransferase subunit GatB [Candidatus Levybacteria bacterium]|nr:Asp-tRNA(Asn)/Glu-tRNA(Gln) amidotransferase subunit GatB [Candidatus Levybacteria bacterium]MBI2189959.1 Asp-tRNA(Asn)/Glu-tRNA(Gln) amidotransferase subunit GatB [Candidatus Levybacteria bacterium]MBI3093227.1 Asp-tRNA(Asn)/Glu-tRNA(Gln) amidotransferase subunit GatB [Candidatus Levybacteria bacterium]